ncbi:multidrug effflux MFS transporter [Campylobacter sp. RM9344]|uniref:Multidrug effflux MFS transporter n=1 Tax=Campylobacter californiensis TaxID=1032243 RepID=A0AAW3ZY90_9BACT|nr:MULTISPECIES: multidrug effflux MFS transporter [unclassified Campylobacter]MBE2984682.1 multidrug effflux MFS transporter [Campylobacter sp. RM6883]MBE2994598.1 multidrug effflux MFS transporter [Campylobacter sp. RM6913]MBE3029124.1 multidrug effflux MFS transporter [Campylobacter sp. RM9344]MBE3608115.1 multidrug effflux MFS transporter [Campylobacter sp. RM9337]QCD50406.1 drug resistance transporter, Bcr/CflA family [Campylobacter sp. RM6914]
MKRKHNSKIFLLLFLGALSAFGPFVIDLYLPALPSISHWFNASTSLTQLTLTTSMAGLAIGQLLIGPISDKFGRKLPLTISLIIYTISTICIFFTASIEMFIFMRVIQGLSSAGSVVIARAVVGDLYSGHEMTKFFSLMMVINSLAPILSPIGGSFLLKVTDWRGIFVVLSVIGIVLFIANFNFKESLVSHRRMSVPLLETYGIYKKIILYKKFMLFVAILTFALGGMFAYIASSAFILQEVFGLSEVEYALCFGANGFALSVGAGISSKLKERRSLYVGVIGLFVSCVYLSVVFGLRLDVWFVVSCFFVQMFFTGFLLPISSALAMNCGREYAGSASAMLGFCPFFLGGIVSPLVGLGDIFVSTTIVICLCFLGVLISFVMVNKFGYLKAR